MPAKKLVRSSSDRMIGGVLGGLAVYLEIDSSLLRLLWVLLTVFTGFVPGLLVYFAALFVVPQK